ncbi:unnamed protein product [Acanthoscelides obtectus]|uniref:C2H2-type domain-containing protein n=1 Tax=Acanthoscelides obtectus TaxID=200917 RepID=A0A9P0K3C2_ACAOB|nr:unnamed protein product [Acanthoscelides obtectus]CAK1631576.1 Zinc finger protein 74 [Acanthoscelides obtectus]
MSERLSLSAQDGAHWNKQMLRQSLNFSNISDITINNEESYMTAIDAGDDTQYLSVIGADDGTFEVAESAGLNEEHIEESTLENNTNNETDQVQNEGNQVIIFNVEGSDELFGLQLAEDEEGNLQKYQFQYRTTEDGQLEAMPETLTLLPNDDIQQDQEITEQPSYSLKVEARIGNKEVCSNETYVEQLEDIPQIVVKGEPTDETFDIEQELADIKPGDTDLPTLNVPNDRITILEYDGFNTESNEHTIENIIITHEDEAAYAVEDSNEMNMYNLNSNHADQERLQQIQEASDTVEDEPESDSETFENSEGPHVTGEEEILLENVHIEVQEPMKSTNTDSAKDCLNPNKLQSKKARPMYHCISEKENLNMIPMYVTNQMTTQGVKPTHPRSLLKCDVDSRVTEKEKSAKPDARFGIVPTMKKQSKFGIDLPANADHIDKRFARSKEAMQAMMFDHFISKTTIPHAPVRHNRLPRKQEIKPVANRRDEEIIVQEVMVSSKGFVENTEERLRNTNQFPITSVVELSDSDDDTVSKSKNKANKSGCDTENLVIEINSDDDIDKNDAVETNNDAIQTNNDQGGDGEGEKRCRSISPKNTYIPSDDSSPSKKSRTESEPESDSGKKEFDCPHCSKSFPSPNSLSTHIQHHNLENSLRKKELKFPRPEYKFKCDNCQESFKNSVLLNRHDCKGNGSNMTCNVCLKKFGCAASLSVHKKSHVKQNLMKNTTTLTVNPMRSIPRPSMSGIRRSLAPVSSALASSSKASRFSFAVPRPSTATARKSVIPKPVVIATKPTETADTTKQKNSKNPETFKCKDCPRVCLTQGMLNLHEKTHKKIACNSCKATFTSRLLLDSHVRFNCVKKTQSPKGRLSFKVRKSFVKTPKTVASSTAAKKPTSSNTKGSTKCSFCAKTFTSLSALFEHKVKKHEIVTPDRSILDEEKSSSLHKPVHGGVRPNQRFKSAFALFQASAVRDNEDKVHTDHS